MDTVEKARQLQGMYDSANKEQHLEIGSTRIRHKPFAFIEVTVRCLYTVVGLFKGIDGVGMEINRPGSMI